jgi:hypothetical protein
MFAFVLLPDALGAPNRVIALTYTPVPEPEWAVAVALGGLVFCGAVRRRRYPLDGRLIESRDQIE